MRRLALLVALVLALAPYARAGGAREVAVTIDDLPQNGRDYGLERMKHMTARLVHAVAAHRVPAVAFVNEAQLYVPGEVDARVALLDEWLSAGIELGNHTFSHKAFGSVTLARYEDEVIRGETVTRMLAERRHLPVRYFRHPYLDTGPNLETSTAFETFLAARGYTVAPVTIDPADWMFAAVYAEAVDHRDKKEMRRIADAYLQYADAAVTYGETFSQTLFGRPIRHVLLLHASELNADYFDELAAIFERRGYAFVTLGRALEDEAYRSPNTYARDEGTTWLNRWALTRGTTGPTPEPSPPEWVSQAYDTVTASAPARIPGSRN